MGDIKECSSQGKIVVLRKSPYEILDENEGSLLSYMKKFYASWGADKRLASVLHNYLAQCDNPHVSVLKLMYNTGDFHASKPKSLAVFIVATFDEWLKMNEATSLVEPQIKQDALCLILEQKNTAFRDLVIKVFNMTTENEIFLPFIQDMLQKKLYKEACQVAGALKLHSRFPPEDFLLPLCVQDKLPVVEDFVRSDKDVLYDFLKYLDGLLVGDTFTSVCDIIGRKEIPDWKVTRCGHKPLSKFMFRLLKKHKIPATLCPNLGKRRQRSALHYLLAKRFDSMEASSEGWAEMALEAVGDSEELQVELVESVLQRGEMDEAETWAQRFCLPEGLWPPQLVLYSQIKRKEVIQSSFPPSAQLDGTQLVTMQFPSDQIILVEDAVQFSRFLDVLEGLDMVGLDSEWKPSFGMTENELALIQVAARSQVFILDRPALARNVPEFADSLVDRLMHNKSILKLGFDLANDVKALRSVLPGLKEIPRLLDMSSLRSVLTEQHHFQFPHCTQMSDGPSGWKLKDLVELCLGVTLDKTEQCSNWEKRPLRRSQLQYAALDAYCLIEVHDVICSECERQGISFKDVTEGMMAGRSPYRSRPAPKLPPTVKDLHVICTWELCRLVKRLRRCGIDATYSDSRQPSKALLKLMRKGYTVLTTVGHPWLTREVKTLKIPAVDERSQLHHVLKHFGVEVLPQDTCTRCPECNENKLMDLPGADLRELREAANRAMTTTCSYLPAEELDDNGDNYEDFDDDYDNSEPGPAPQPIVTPGPNRLTSAGAVILAEQVPPAVADDVSSFTACIKCGFVLWPVTLEDMFLYD